MNIIGREIERSLPLGGTGLFSVAFECINMSHTNIRVYSILTSLNELDQNLQTNPSLFRPHQTGVVWPQPCWHALPVCPYRITSRKEHNVLMCFLSLDSMQLYETNLSLCFCLVCLPVCLPHPLFLCHFNPQVGSPSARHTAGGSCWVPGEAGAESV